MTAPTQKCAGLIDEISAAFPITLQRMGRCGFPKWLASVVAAEGFKTRRIICSRRVELSNRELIPSHEPPRFFARDRSFVAQMWRGIST